MEKLERKCRWGNRDSSVYWLQVWGNTCWRQKQLDFTLKLIVSVIQDPYYPPTKHGLAQHLERFCSSLEECDASWAILMTVMGSCVFSPILIAPVQTYCTRLGEARKWPCTYLCCCSMKQLRLGELGRAVMDASCVFAFVLLVTGGIKSYFLKIIVWNSVTLPNPPKNKNKKKGSIWQIKTPCSFDWVHPRTNCRVICKTRDGRAVPAVLNDLWIYRSPVLFALLSDYYSIHLPWTCHTMSLAGLAETQGALLIGLSLAIRKLARKWYSIIKH